ncbi:MAG: histone deacetylase family protein [Paracoccaceae bacterium]
MPLALFSHPASHRHLTPPGHPERAARIEAVDRALADFDGLDRREAPAAEDAFLLRGHSAAYLDAIRATAPAEGSAQLDPDTHMSPGTLEAALRAAGANAAAVDLVLSGERRAAFVAARPPGHHAEPERAMGFCLFSNAALAALHALEAHGLSRVAVADFDVHHGNGTQAVLWEEGRAAFASSHQMPLFPGSGAARERGAREQCLNSPLDPGAGSAEFRAAWEGTLLPFLARHEPELVIVSAGFDAHRDDPLADIRLTEQDFSWITERLCDLAEEHAEGRIVSTLEGGYDLDALAASVAAHVSVLEERTR